MHNFFNSGKAWLSFLTGRNPVVEKSRNDFRSFIPAQNDGIVVISADFELAWAWRYAGFDHGAKHGYITIADRERNNIPLILAQCDKYNIPVTWGTVGHLFLEHCETRKGRKHNDIIRLPYFKNRYWHFSEGDWFDHDPATDYLSSPEWYAPDLIKLILKSKVCHEIACHTFSHISCNEDICSPAILESELAASKNAADKLGIKLESFIFPGHSMGNYEVIKRCGYKSIRSNNINTLGYPVLLHNGLWEHKATMELRFNDLFSVKENLNRFYRIIDRCIRNHLVCHFWFHPSFCNTSVEIILPHVFKYLQDRDSKIWVTTMSDYTKWLNNHWNN
jgi:hypothetical protein